MISKSNNRNAVAASLVLMVLFAAVLAGSGSPHNSHEESSERADSNKISVSRNAVGQGSPKLGDDGSEKTVEMASTLGPIAPYVIAGGGGTSASGNFTLDGTMGEPSAADTQSGGGFTFNGGFWNMPPGLSPTLAPVINMKGDSVSIVDRQTPPS